jgi:hypothetical protein
MSSDSDFMPLVMRIRQEGLPVYGFGSARTPEGFRQACTRFIDVSGLVAQASDSTPTPRPSRRKASASTTTATPEPEPAIEEATSVDDDLVKLFGDAWKAAKRDADGYASLSEVGRIAGNRSSFDVRSYGFAKFSDLIATLPEFRTEDRDGRMYVKRVR